MNSVTQRSIIFTPNTRITIDHVTDWRLSNCYRVRRVQSLSDQNSLQPALRCLPLDSPAELWPDSYCRARYTRASPGPRLVVSVWSSPTLRGQYVRWVYFLNSCCVCYCLLSLQTNLASCRVNWFFNNRISTTVMRAMFIAKQNTSHYETEYPCKT
jgi:hypothetical protein